MRLTFPLRVLRCAVAVAVLHPLFGSPARAQTDYAFTMIAESSAPLSGFGGVALNNAGTVVFGAGQSTFPYQFTSILSGNGGALTTVADTSGPFSGFQAPSINNGGTVALAAALGAGGSSIVTGNGGALTTLYDAGSGLSGFANGYVSAPSINDAGVVAFGADITPRLTGLFTGDGGPTTTLATAPFGGNPNDVVRFAGPVINNAGDVAFFYEYQLQLSRDGSLTTIATSGLLGGFAPVSLNDAGVLASTYPTPVGGSGVFTSNGGPPTTYVTVGGLPPFRTVSINNAGTVAFTFNPTNPSLVGGIYAGPDLLTGRVVGFGDALFGSRVSTLALFRDGLNDSGQIAFTARLADGRTVVVRADPTNVIPEPGTLTLLAAGLLSLVGPGRRARISTRPHPETLPKERR